MFDVTPRLVLPLAFLLASAAPLAAQSRHAEAHVHGMGHLMLVIEDSTISIDLTIPASDIVGFERQPATPEEQTAVESASTALSLPLDLFAVTPSPACTVTAAAAELDADDDHHHAEFIASALLDCSGLEQATELRTSLFDQFERAEAVEVDALVNGKALSATLTRQQPTMTLR